MAYALEMYPENFTLHDHVLFRKQTLSGSLT